MLSLVKLILLFSIYLTANASEQDCPKDKGVKAKYLIFVSFSMPKGSLQSLYKEASLNEGVLLIRGLKDLSFKATASYLKLLGIGVQIDPEAFKRYEINKVPTIVLIKNQQFKSISGNVTLSYAKELLESS